MRIATAETRNALKMAIGDRSQRAWAIDNNVSPVIVNDCLLGKGVRVERENKVRATLGLEPYGGARIDKTEHVSREVLASLNQDELLHQINLLIDTVNDARRLNKSLIKELKKQERRNLENHRSLMAINGPGKRGMVSQNGFREEVYRRDNYHCRYCGKDLRREVYHIDHVYPLSLGGVDHPDNLVTACVGCNVAKGKKLGVWPYPIGHFDNGTNGD